MNTMAISFLPRFIRRDLLLTEEAWAEKIRTGEYDIDGEVPSYCDFDRQHRQLVSAQYGCDFVDTYTALHDEGLRKIYATYIAGRFNRGATITNRLWRLLDPACRIAIADTDRGRMGYLTLTSRNVQNCPTLPTRRAGKSRNHPRQKAQ